MYAKPGSLAPHSLITWMSSGIKLFGGLLDFTGRPGVPYYLAWRGMKIFILNTKDALTIFFTQCYLVAILRSASLPGKHPTIQLAYWAEIVHLFPSSTRMVASFGIPCPSSARTWLRRCTQGGANPWADSCKGWIRSRKSSWCLTMCPPIDGCLLLKGLGGGGGGVLGWYGFDYDGIDCEYFFLVLCLNCANLHVPCWNWLRINTIYILGFRLVCGEGLG